MLLSAISDKFILIVYSSKWALAIPFMQVVCFQYLFNIIGEANLQAMNAIGRSDITFKLEFIKKPLYLAIILYTLTISPLAMVAGNTIYGLIGGTINAIPNKRLINYSYAEQLKDIGPQVMLAIMMGLFVYLIGRWNANEYMVLAVQIIAGLAFYFIFAKLTKMESMIYLMKTINEVRKRQ